MRVPSGMHGFTRVKPYMGPAGARKSETENPHRACFSARGPAKIGEKQEPPLRKLLRTPGDLVCGMRGCPGEILREVSKILTGTGNSMHDIWGPSLTHAWLSRVEPSSQEAFPHAVHSPLLEFTTYAYRIAEDASKIVNIHFGKAI